MGIYLKIFMVKYFPLGKLDRKIISPGKKTKLGMTENCQVQVVVQDVASESCLKLKFQFKAKPAPVMYYVERILSDRVDKRTGVRQFKIRWKDYKPSDDTWEPEENLHKSLVLDYDHKKVQEASQETSYLVGMLPIDYVIESHRGTRWTTGSRTSKTTTRISEFFVKSPEGRVYSALPKQIPETFQLQEYMYRRVYVSPAQIPDMYATSEPRCKEVLDLSAEESTPDQIRSHKRKSDELLHHRYFIDGACKMVHNIGPTRHGARENILSDELESMEKESAPTREQVYACFIRAKRRMGIPIDRYTVRIEFEEYILSQDTKVC